MKSRWLCSAATHHTNDTMCRVPGGRTCRLLCTCCAVFRSGQWSKWASSFDLAGTGPGYDTFVQLPRAFGRGGRLRQRTAGRRASRAAGLRDGRGRGRGPGLAPGPEVQVRGARPFPVPHPPQQPPSAHAQSCGEHGDRLPANYACRHVVNRLILVNPSTAYPTSALARIAPLVARFPVGLPLPVPLPLALAPALGTSPQRFAQLLMGSVQHMQPAESLAGAGKVRPPHRRGGPAPPGLRLCGPSACFSVVHTHTHGPVPCPLRPPRPALVAARPRPGSSTATSPPPSAHFSPPPRDVHVRSCPTGPVAELRGRWVGCFTAAAPPPPVPPLQPPPTLPPVAPFTCGSDPHHVRCSGTPRCACNPRPPHPPLRHPQVLRDALGQVQQLSRSLPQQAFVHRLRLLEEGTR